MPILPTTYHDPANNPFANLLQFFGLSIQAEKYTPYNKGLSWAEYTRIHQTNPIVAKLVNMRRANVGANGWDVHCNLFVSEKKNENYANTLKNQLKALNINKLISDYVTITSIYGNSFAYFNDDNKPVIQKPEFFNLYYDTINQKARKISLLIDGKETKNFEDGVDITHFREPSSSFKPLADSPIDSCYGWILLYEHAIQANNTLVSRGFIGGLLAIFDEEMAGQLDQIVDEEKKLTMGQKIINRLMDAFGGSKNSNKMAYISGVKEIMELGKSNRDMQLTELIEKAVHSIYDSFGIEQTGKESTYNNANTFKYQQYDLIGKPYEDQFCDWINQRLLPYYTIETSEDLRFQFNPPTDPDELVNKTFYLQAFQALSTLNSTPEYKEQIANEFREKIGLDQLDSGLFVGADPQLPDPNQPPGPVRDANFFSKGVESFEQSTPIAKALKSKDFLGYITDEKGNRQERGLFASFKKAITKQLNKAIGELEKLTELPDEIELPKVETYYSFNSLKKDLLKFTEPAVEELKLIQSKEKFDQFVYPEYLLEIVDQRTEALLKGTKTYAGMDAETAGSVNSILRQNLSKGVAEVVNILRDRVQSIAESRAKLIAENEVASVVEQSRQAVYTNEGYQYERWLNVEDKRVCATCNANENKGVVEIGTMNIPAHVNCRCSKIYGVTKEDIS